MKTLLRVRRAPEVADFWNWTSKNIPDCQKFEIRKKSTKSLHPTALHKPISRRAEGTIIYFPWALFLCCIQNGWFGLVVNNGMQQPPDNDWQFVRHHVFMSGILLTEHFKYGFYFYLLSNSIYSLLFSIFLIDCLLLTYNRYKKNKCIFFHWKSNPSDCIILIQCCNLNTK